MEARVAGEKNHFYAAGASEMSGLGKKSVEWDLNNWRWDGELFLASPLNPAPSDCRNKRMFLGSAGQSNILSSCSEESEFGLLMKGHGETEKRRKISAVEDAEPCEGSASLALKLGGHDYPIVEADLADWGGKNGKQLKLQGGNPNRSTCQVEGCGTDLSGCKDYHRRHKVCEMHAKASMALVGNVMQRFCQQCSRFHLLQEFDEGKRSCRRRLAGHNRRRRKTHPDAPVAGSLIDNQTSTYVLISLLRILSNLHSDSADQSKDQEFVSHILKNLASFGGSCDARKLSGLLQASQDLQKDRTSAGTSSEAARLDSNGAPAEDASRHLCSTSKTTCVTGDQRTSPGPTDHAAVAVATLDMPSKSLVESSLPGSLHVVPPQRPASFVPADANSAEAEALCSLQQMPPGESDLQRARLKDFDLNNAYIDQQDCCEECDKSPGPANVDAAWALIDSHQSSPPQTSGNSDSTSSRSLSTSNGDAQSRTDKIVFKLFGKDPNDAPLTLRSQILDWLSHSPTDMESYIRPGCIILTVYLRLTESAWEELSQDLTSKLDRLLHVSEDDFWRKGWIYVMVHHHAAFIFNGSLMLATPELPWTPNNYGILCVTPIAVSVSTRASFTVKGYNLAQSTMRLLCAFEGRYLLQETTQALVKSSDTSEDHEGLQCLSFSCSMPKATGRGFIEVEDSCLSSSFFPFIIAEEDVCSEIRMLEDVINVVAGDQHSHESLKATDTRNQALDFLNEMGWLLRRSHSRSIYEQKNPCPNVFSLTRFRWLMAYAMDREWCAVVKKLLDILFQGTVDVGGLPAVEVALSEYLLHSAVRKKSKSMVELLLRYKVDPETEGTGPDNLLFRPDMMGASNITPLHIAATSTGYESILDALTNDPGLLGIKAWNLAQDSTGYTPKDYARSQGYESYINLVQKKIDKQHGNGHVVLNIPGSLMSPVAASRQLDGPSSGKLTGFEIGKSKMTPTPQPFCKLCSQQLVHRSYLSRSLLYRPAMLSLVGIAAVCVCVALLFKGPPNVMFVRHPFSWESLGCGTM